MTHKESGLPVASPTSQDLISFDKLSKALAQAKNPADKLKIASQALKIGRHCELQGLFDKGLLNMTAFIVLASFLFQKTLSIWTDTSKDGLTVLIALTGLCVVCLPQSIL